MFLNFFSVYYAYLAGLGKRLVMTKKLFHVHKTSAAKNDRL